MYRFFLLHFPSISDKIRLSFHFFVRKKRAFMLQTAHFSGLGVILPCRNGNLNK
jgi:hypothetical protein